MKTDLEHRAAKIVELGQTIDRYERHMHYGSDRIACLATDDLTGSPEFAAEVAAYRELREGLRATRAEYADLLAGPWPGRRPLM